MKTITRIQPAIEQCIGIHPNGPAMCIECRQPFKSGECWLRLTSADDPVLGRYSLGIHEKCVEPKSSAPRSTHSNPASKGSRKRQVIM